MVDKRITEQVLPTSFMSGSNRTCGRGATPLHKVRRWAKTTDFPASAGPIIAKLEWNSRADIKNRRTKTPVALYIPLAGATPAYGLFYGVYFVLFHLIRFPKWLHGLLLTDSVISFLDCYVSDSKLSHNFVFQRDLLDILIVISSLILET